MKKVEAVIRQEAFAKVKDALAEAGFPGLTAYEVKGRGKQKGVSMSYRTTEYRIDLLPKMKIELVVDDKDAGKVVDIIVGSAKTGNIGDGKIFVSSVGRVIRIRTGEKDSGAI